MGTKAYTGPLWGGRGRGQGKVQKQQNQLSNDALESPLRLEVEGTS